MQEVYYCGRVGRLEDRLPIVDERARGAFRCRGCGHVDHLLWLSDDGRSRIFEEAGRSSHSESLPLAV
jgi:hypothetical protein